jgi:hypothetical protein
LLGNCWKGSGRARLQPCRGISDAALAAEGLAES